MDIPLNAYKTGISAYDKIILMMLQSPFNNAEYRLYYKVFNQFCIGSFEKDACEASVNCSDSSDKFEVMLTNFLSSMNIYLQNLKKFH